VSGWHYRRVVVMERRLDGALPDLTARLPVRMAVLSPDELPQLAAFRPDLDPDVIRRRLGQGHCCFVAWHEDRIVHAGWAATREAWVDILDCEFPLEPGDVYQFDSYTVPAFRGSGVAGARVVWMARYFQAARMRRLFAVVWPRNEGAFRPLEKAGYLRCGSLRVVRWGRWRRVIHTRSRSRQ
jgi:hypothetical protein